MSKENETEKIISDKLNNREFAFDEKAWAGMETLLDAQGKKRKRGAFWWFSAVALIALVGGTLWVLTPVNNKNTEKSPLATTSNELAATKNPLATTANELAAAENQLKMTANPLTTTSNELAATKNPLATTANGLVAAENPLKMTANPLTTTSNELAATKNQLKMTANELAMVPAHVADAPTQAAEVPSQVAEAPTQAVEITTQVAEQADSAKTTEEALEIAKQNPLTAPGKETKNAWGILAGAGYWFPYLSNTAETKHNGVIGFTGGIYYQRSLGKRFDLGLSILYSSRGALNFDKTVTNSNYGFGVESDKTTISPQTLHYLNVPLHIRFNISQRSHIIIGASYYQLLATTSKVTHTIENSFASTITSSEKQTGEHPGFRKNDIVAFLGYEFTLFDRMNAGLQFNYGFYDITDNSYNNLAGNDHNISLQLQLKYDLIRH